MRSTIAIAFLFAILITGCDSTGPDDDTDADAQVAGSYEATTFQLERPDETYDILEQDGEFDLTLSEGGEVDGHFLVPCSIPDSCEDPEADSVEISFGGVYEVEQDTVNFDHSTDTFVREIPWLYEEGTLSASTGGPDGGLRVVLTRN